MLNIWGLFNGAVVASFELYVPVCLNQFVVKHVRVYACEESTEVIQWGNYCKVATQQLQLLTEEPSLMTEAPHSHKTIKTPMAHSFDLQQMWSGIEVPSKLVLLGFCKPLRNLQILHVGRDSVKSEVEINCQEWHFGWQRRRIGGRAPSIVFPTLFHLGRKSAMSAPWINLQRWTSSLHICSLSVMVGSQVQGQLFIKSHPIVHKVLPIKSQDLWGLNLAR